MLRVFIFNVCICISIPDKKNMKCSIIYYYAATSTLAILIALIFLRPVVNMTLEYNCIKFRQPIINGQSVKPNSLDVHI